MDSRLRAASLLIFSLFAFSLLDSCTTLGDRGGVARGLRGAPVYVSGTLDSSGPDLERLAAIRTNPRQLAANILYETDNLSGTLIVQELSGRMWRGIYSVSEDSPPGDYTLLVHQKGVPVDKGTSHVTIRIFEDETAMRADMETFSERLFGFKPWWITLAAFPCCLLLLWVSYKTSLQEEAALQARGMSTIFKMARSSGGWEIAFSLGRCHGVREGSEVLLCDPAGQAVGAVTVRDAFETSATAFVPSELRLTPRHMVSVIAPQTTAPTSDHENET